MVPTGKCDGWVARGEAQLAGRHRPGSPAQYRACLLVRALGGASGQTDLTLIASCFPPLICFVLNRSLVHTGEPLVHWRSAYFESSAPLGRQGNWARLQCLTILLGIEMNAEPADRLARCAEVSGLVLSTQGPALPSPTFYRAPLAPRRRQASNSRPQRPRWGSGRYSGRGARFPPLSGPRSHAWACMGHV